MHISPSLSTLAHFAHPPNNGRDTSHSAWEVGGHLTDTLLPACDLVVRVTEDADKNVETWHTCDQASNSPDLTPESWWAVPVAGGPWSTDNARAIA